MRKLIKAIVFCLFILVFAGVKCAAFETSCENEIAELAGMKDISVDVLTEEELSGDSEINLFGKYCSLSQTRLKPERFRRSNALR